MSSETPEVLPKSPGQNSIAVFRSLLAGAFLAPSVMAGGSVINIAGKLADPPRDKEIASRIASLWSATLLGILDIPLEVEGLENLSSKEASVVASNHDSLLDSPILAAALGRKRLNMAFVAKESLDRAPFLRGIVRTMGIPPIDRKNTAEAKAAINARAKELAEQKMNTVFFAQGTRSEDGKIGKLKKGFAHTAIQTQTSVVPAYIDGSFRAMSRHSRIARPGRVRVAFGERIPTEGMTEKDVDALVDLTRGRILEMQQEAQTC